MSLVAVLVWRALLLLVAMVTSVTVAIRLCGGVARLRAHVVDGRRAMRVIRASLRLHWVVKRRQLCSARIVIYIGRTL